MSMKRLMIAALVVIAVACSREKARETAGEGTERTKDVAGNVRDAVDAAVPLGNRRTREEIEKERFDEAWRQATSFKVPRPRPSPAPLPATPAPDPSLTFVTDAKFGEKLAEGDFSAIDSLPLRVPVKGDVSGPSILRAQVLLDRAHFSVGAIDGRWGKNSAIAVYWFQNEAGLEPTGDIDVPTYQALVQRGGKLPTLVSYTLTADDVDGPFTTIPEDVYDKEKLDCLCYESISEMLSEKFHATSELLETINPNIKLGSVQAGQSILVPNVRPPVGEQTPDDVVKIVVSANGWYLHGLDASGNVLFHAPTTLGTQYDPSPDETLKIVGIAHDPHFHYQPKLFHEIPDDEPEANLQPGPNSPVGVVWMALSKKHFGIHGTSDPDTIGYASSHGCIRLTNWDATELSYRVQKGVSVSFVDTRTALASAEVKSESSR